MKMLVDIDVPDLQKGIDFYCSAFDLRLKRTLDSDVAELEGGSSIIYLLQKSEGSKCAGAIPDIRKYSRHWTPVHIDFVVDDLGRAVERVIDAGAILETECISWRGSKCITFSDPFGNGFCLIEFENETYSDEIA
ncbi:VOC family protein [Janthinobacterium sp. 17J80-10]|uniref:VOC family protein n=1 Tax=Janthinobacterium sp. 17J80-10 TaxID=2497863 RepID=UPI001005497D|nr:VOC family protein [Janthinobacterium sp. 17J80-10]QAU33418.1 VOC family protein [Janthinobacterium sp. 17J80-10]